MKTPITIISLSAILASMTLLAQETQPESNDVLVDPRLKRFDKGGDGRISDSERAAELMGREFLCVAVGSPWMTDPFVYMMGKPDEPPLSLVPASARDQLMANGHRLLGGMKARGLSDADVKAHLAKNSIEANAAKIVIPSLFMTSLADEHAPHLLVKPTFDRLKAAREQIVAFFAKQFARADVEAAATAKVSSGPAPETKTEDKTDSRIRPTASQSADIRKFHERMSSMRCRKASHAAPSASAAGNASSLSTFPKRRRASPRPPCSPCTAAPAARESRCT